MLLLSAAARADSPLPLPGPVQALSPGRRCEAIAGVSPAQIVVRARARPERILWSLPFWNPNMVLSDDCRVLGAGYVGGALLALTDKAPDTEVMSFYRDGQLVRAVRLGELYPDLAVLPRTASHWLWQERADWSGRTWTVHTVDGRTISVTP